MDNKLINIDNIKKVFEKKFYIFHGEQYNLNIIGIRNDVNPIFNKFDDMIVVIFTDGNGKELIRKYPATTDPGKFYMHNLLNKKGTAILVPGQYIRSHRLGLHRGKYLALTQINPVKVYRDRNKDNIYDYDPNSIEEGIFGINIHRASKYGSSILVNKWSAGCQVIKDVNDFEELISLAQIHNRLYENIFDYTLINYSDIINI